MSSQPTAKDMIELPADYTFKFIVHPEKITAELLVEMALQVLARESEPPAVTANPSRGGKYVSYSLTLHIKVYEEIEAVYTHLKSHHAVIMTL